MTRSYAWQVNVTEYERTETPVDGEQLAALVKKIYATPKPIVDKIGELIK